MKKSIYLTKLCITIIITLVILILIKSNTNFKKIFYEKVYNTNFSFNKINEIYTKYVGNFDLLDKYVENVAVFNETLSYEKKEDYKDGVKLTVQNNYLVPINESGIVVYIGEKENYGNTVIIQRIDGIDEWYGNMSNVNVKLYDYVKKGELLGEANNVLYLVYKKQGNTLEYEEVFK